MRLGPQFPSFYRMVPNEAYQYKGIVYLLLHFHWIWVGIVASGDDNGEFFVQTLIPMLSQHGICTAFTEKTPSISQTAENLGSLGLFRAKSFSMTISKIKVLVVCAEPQTMTALIWMIYFFSLLEGATETSMGKVWIMTAHWDFSLETMHRASDIQVFDGALSFVIYSKEVLGFTQFLQNLHPDSAKGDGFIRIFWQQAFNCLFPDSNEHREEADSCTGQENLKSLPGTLFEMSMTGQSYSIYNAAQAIAYTLHRLNLFRIKHGRLDPQNLQPWQVRVDIQSHLLVRQKYTA